MFVGELLVLEPMNFRKSLRWVPLAVMLLLTLWFIFYQATAEPDRSTAGESGKERRKVTGVAQSPETTVQEAAKDPVKEASKGSVRKSPQEVGANEAGSIMVLEHHRVGGDPGFAPYWTISAEQFREELDYLYENDYYPINPRDLIENRIDVPAGKTPVVWMFDDSSDTQFTMVRRGGGWVPDPEGAVGVLADFHKEHRDWPMRATFFVLPKADPPNDLFGQPKLAGKKLQYLVDNGMEVGTHTLYHANLSTASRAVVQEQLARSVSEIQKHLPDYEVKTLGVSFGEYPADFSLLKSGSWNGNTYQLEGAVQVAGGASHPPGHRDLIPTRFPVSRLSHRKAS